MCEAYNIHSISNTDFVILEGYNCSSLRRFIDLVTNSDDAFLAYSDGTPYTIHIYMIFGHTGLANQVTIQPTRATETDEKSTHSIKALIDVDVIDTANTC